VLKSRRDNCPDVLDAYFKSIRGKPQIEAKEKLMKEKLTPVSSVKKCKLADDSPLPIPKVLTPAKRKQTAKDVSIVDTHGLEKNAKLNKNNEGNFLVGL